MTFEQQVLADPSTRFLVRKLLETIDERERDPVDVLDDLETVTTIMRERLETIRVTPCKGGAS